MSPDEEAPHPAKVEGSSNRLSYPTTQDQATAPDRPKTATAYKPGTQIDRVLQALLRGWVCGTWFLEAKIPRYAARVSDLRNDGWNVERRRCADPSHRHKSAQREWRIDRKPAAPGQLFGDPL